MGFNLENGKLKYYRIRPHDELLTLSVPEDTEIVKSYTMLKIKHIEMATSIFIHKGVKGLYPQAFCKCTNMRNFQVSKLNMYMTEVDGVLYDKLKQTLLCCPPDRGYIHLPASVKYIQETNAFAGCHDLKYITADKYNRKFTVIDGVLYQLEKGKPVKLVRCPVDIQHIDIPETVTQIAGYAFRNCTELAEITIPEQVTEIPEYAFRNCHQLSQLHLHSGIKLIDKYAFEGCKSLREVIIPSGVEKITFGAFYDCELIDILDIPESVTKVGYLGAGGYRTVAVSCHGIELPARNGHISSMICMIVNENLNEDIPPEFKYPLLYQMFLRNQDSFHIKKYIQNHFTEIMTYLIQQNQKELTKHYLDSFQECLNAQNLDELIRVANEQKNYDLQLFLTDLKYQKNAFAPKDWSL